MTVNIAVGLESFPRQGFEIADVSLVEGTIAGCNYSFFFASPRNGIEEADGSIPFSSTKVGEWCARERPWTLSSSGRRSAVRARRGYLRVPGTAMNEPFLRAALAWSF